MATVTNAGEIPTSDIIREEEEEEKERGSFGTKKKQYVRYHGKDTKTGRVVVGARACCIGNKNDNGRNTDAIRSNSRNNNSNSNSNNNNARGNALYVDATGMVAMAVQGQVSSPFDSDIPSFDSDESSRSTIPDEDSFHDCLMFDSRYNIRYHDDYKDKDTGDGVALTAASAAAAASPLSPRGANGNTVVASETSPAHKPHDDYDDDNDNNVTHSENHAAVSVQSQETPVTSQDAGSSSRSKPGSAVETAADGAAEDVGGGGDKAPRSPRSVASPKKSDDRSALTERTTGSPQPRRSFTIKNINLEHPISLRDLSDKSARSQSDKSAHSLILKQESADDDGSDVSDTTPVSYTIAIKQQQPDEEGSDLSEPSQQRIIVPTTNEDPPSEAKPIKLPEPIQQRIIFPYMMDDSFSTATPIVFREPSQPHLDDDSLSETTPVNFHEPSGEFTVRSSKTRSDDGSDLSETTPIKFHESSGHLTLSDGASNPSEPFSSRSLFQQHKSASQTHLGIARKKSSRVLTDDELEADAERDIVNVYLEAAAFAGQERLNLTEDIYSFVLACSTRSVAFVFAIYFIFVKYLCYGVLLVNLVAQEYQGEQNKVGVIATKFLMIPVSVSMQEDLITVYYNVANKRYDALTYKRNMSATWPKWVLCNLLRAIDGFLGLLVNFYVMLVNTDILDIFLSFAALHFLQFIDDVIYELAEKGFFGHKLEQATIACKVITFTRRTQTGDRCNNMITDLDTILLVSSIILCYGVYIVYIALFYSSEENRQIYNEGFGADP